MADVIGKTQAFLRTYGLDPALVDVDACARAFQADMERGLRGDPDAWMMMLPTYLSLDGDIPRDTPTIVIDAGGTNFRIGLVTITDHGPVVEGLRVFPMPGSQEPITWETFVDQVSDAILPLTDRSRRVGFCFSYAAEILPNRDGRVLNLSKQVQISGSAGKELGRDLSAALAAKGAEGVAFVVLNDTVAALLGGVAALGEEHFDGYIGLIYGTGVNTCYVERREQLGKVTTPWDRDTMLINMESARFDGVPMSAFDRALDENSVDPGLCHYEKMVSGRYQGELVWRALRQGAADGLFSSGLSDFLTGLEGLTMVQADAFAARPYGENLLAAACGGEEDREMLYTVIDRVVERSARLVCANLAGILLQTGSGQHIHRPACVVAEGSTFYKGHLFRGKLERLCGSYITGTLGRHLAFRQVADANLVGTAAAALLNP
ncbi:hexokinase family protein [Intestinimonas sp.]|uniref:hexokinase family protein n=1 Tax=Intestinimonas sp. TaxID=1965293 RepID=UPI00261E2553|nr:hypothetical protein [Intestinimonas sp.]